MDSFVSKVPSKQSNKLQFQSSQKSKCIVKLINLSFPLTPTVTSKDNVTNYISENNVSSSCETFETCETLNP